MKIVLNIILYEVSCRSVACRFRGKRWAGAIKQFWLSYRAEMSHFRTCDKTVLPSTAITAPVECLKVPRADSRGRGEFEF